VSWSNWLHLARVICRRRPSISLITCVGAAVLLVACSPTEGSATSTTSAAAVATTTIPRMTIQTSTPQVPRLTHAVWKSTVKGVVFAQPVVVGSRVFVATEDDDVYALALHTGRVLWHASIGAPLTNVAEHAGCGDIDPLGITSTPVADPANGTVYVVGEISNGADPPTVHRELVGFDMATGKVVRRADADPTGGGVSQINLQQRAGLVIDSGRVDVAFGGLYGDCGYYHGWVVGVSITPGEVNIEFDTTSGGSGGAVWQGGAPPSVGADGALYVITGNQNSQGTAGYYESVVKLSPALAPEASFRDTAATDDEDFGTSTPLLLPNGTLFAVGKTDIGYVLKQSNLRLVARIPGVCGSNPDGRIAFDAATDAAYVPCRTGGIQQVKLATDRLGWKAGTVNSSPILAAGSLWALSYPDGDFQALNPLDGRVEQSTRIGQTANFATPAYAGGLVLAANATGTVVAF
jgi:polyvinyl alcohol dehydrogenase (cytochrome)